MPTVASILRNIEDIRVPRAVSNVLREEAGSISKASTFLHEELQAIKATGKAVTKEDLADALRKMPDADRAAFRSAYTKYKTAMLDTIAPGAKVPTAEIDNNFFNGVLKGVGDSVQEKALLRAAVLKNDPVLPKGVSAADYAAHKSPTAPTIELSAKDKATREAVQTAEQAKASQQIGHGESRGARSEAVTEGRKTAAEQAKAAEQASRAKAAQLADDAKPGAVAGFTKGEVKKFSAVDDLDPDKGLKAFPDKAEYDRFIQYRKAVNEPKEAEKAAKEVAEKAAKSADIAVKLKSYATELDAVGLSRRATGVQDLPQKLETMEEALRAQNLIKADGPRSGLSPAGIMKKIKTGEEISASDFKALETHFRAWHGSNVPHPSTQQVSSSAGIGGMKGIALSEAAGAVKETLQSAKSVAHVKDYLGREGYKAVRDQYETFFQRNKWALLGTGTLTLGSLVMQATDSSSDEFDNNLGWGARIEYNLTKMATGLPYVGGDIASNIKAQKSDNPVVQALQGALKATDQRAVEAQNQLNTKTREQQNSSLEQRANEALISTVSGTSKDSQPVQSNSGAAKTSTDISPEAMAKNFNLLSDPNFGGIEASKVSKLRQMWDDSAGDDSTMSADELKKFKSSLDQDAKIGLNSEEKGVVWGILAPNGPS